MQNIVWLRYLTAELKIKPKTAPVVNFGVDFFAGQKRNRKQLPKSLKCVVLQGTEINAGCFVHAGSKEPRSHKKKTGQVWEVCGVKVRLCAGWGAVPNSLNTEDKDLGVASQSSSLLADST